MAAERRRVLVRASVSWCVTTGRHSVPVCSVGLHLGPVRPRSNRAGVALDIEPHLSYRETETTRASAEIESELARVEPDRQPKSWP